MVKYVGSNEADEYLGGDSKDKIKGLAGDDRLDGGGGDDKIDGGFGNDTLTGGLGDDLVSGGAGDDLIYAIDPGKDVIDGGGGIDTVVYGDYESGVLHVDLAILTFQDTGGGGTDRLAGIENLQGGVYDDTLLGSDAANNLTGLFGDDYIDGRGGDDVLNLEPVDGDNGGDDYVLGGDGNDFLYGGEGVDILNGGAGHDIAKSYFFAFPGGPSRSVTISLADHGVQTVDSAGNQMMLVSIEELNGDSSTNDDFTGSGGADTLRGFGGFDRLDGGEGDDVLSGGYGSTTLTGGLGLDTADFSASSSRISLDLGETEAQDTGDGFFTLSSIEGVICTTFNDVVLGSARTNSLVGGDGDDLLFGYEAADTLSGGSGEDLLLGGTGADVMSGGAGADTFSYGTTADASPLFRDLIWDLADEDRISLTAIDANTTLGGSQAFVLVANHTAAGQITVAYDAGENRTTISLWTNADGIADGIIQVRGDHADFDNFAL
jgi:Ca2+-binding RTX toxin-like protein